MTFLEFFKDQTDRNLKRVGFQQLAIFAAIVWLAGADRAWCQLDEQADTAKQVDEQSEQETGDELDGSSHPGFGVVTVTRRWKALRAPYEIKGTQDGEYFYVSSYKNGGIGIFKRNPASGEISNQGVLSGRKGFISLDFNRKETRAVGCSYSSGLYLFERNTKDGSLTELYHLKNSEAIENSLNSPYSVFLSPDGRFAYAANGTGELSVFRITKDDKMEFIQKHQGLDDCLVGARLMVADAEGKTLFVAAGKAGTLSVFKRHRKSGMVGLVSYVINGQDDISVLDGAHGVALSPDEKYVYVVCGRFIGSDSICVFEVDRKKQLKLVQEWEPELDTPFVGGSHIGVSPDGQHVVATAWETKNIAHFARDAQTGEIEFKDFLYGSKIQIGKTTLPYFSPDSKFLYLGSYSGNVITFGRQDEP